MSQDRLRVKGLKMPRLATPRPANFTHKGDVPLRPFSGNQVLLEKYSSAPLTYHLLGNEIAKVANTDLDPAIHAFLYLHAPEMLTEQEKQAGIMALGLRGLGRAAGAAAKVVSPLSKRLSASLSQGSSRAYQAASRRYDAAAQKALDKLPTAKLTGNKVTGFETPVAQLPTASYRTVGKGRDGTNIISIDKLKTPASATPKALDRAAANAEKYRAASKRSMDKSYDAARAADATRAARATRIAENEARRQGRIIGPKGLALAGIGTLGVGSYAGMRAGARDQGAPGYNYGVR